jgi:hypothetical protein
MAISLKDAVGRIFDNIQDWRLVLLKDWAAIVGPLHTQMRLERVNGDTLIIGVYDVYWMQELYLLSRTIINTINTALGAQYVRHVRFKLVERQDSRAITQPPAGSLVHEKNRPLTKPEHNALAYIKDPELKKVLQLFLMRATGVDL